MTDEPSKPMLRVEVAFAEPDQQEIVRVELTHGATVADAIEQARIAERFPQIRIDPKLVGVWNRKRPMDFALSDGDRVEIYRPLLADPKEIRRQRAAGEKP